MPQPTIGDFVSIVRPYGIHSSEESDYIGREGVIETMDSTDAPYKVRFSDGDYVWAYEVRKRDAVQIPASVFDGTDVSFAQLRKVFAVLNKHGVNLDWDN